MITPETAKKLVDSTRRLNEASNKLNNIFDIINKELGKLNIGLIFNFPIPDGKLTLCYGKFDEKWQLGIANEQNSWAITHAPRYYKVKIVNYLPDFLEAYRIFVEEMTKEIQDAANLAESFVKAIDAKS